MKERLQAAPKLKTCLAIEVAPTSNETKQLPLEEENGNPQTAVVAATTPVVELLWPSDPLRKILWRDH